MRNHLTHLLAIFFLLVCMTVEIQSQGAGVIEGQVFNATPGGTPVSKVPVILWALDAQDQEILRQEATNEEGRVRFENLDTAGYSYQLQAEHQGVSYGSDVVAFGQGENLLSVSVAVYDATTHDADLWVERAHLILEFQAGTLLLQEVQIFVNAGTKTYVSSGGAGGHTTHFSLPQAATELQLTEGLMACCIERTDGGFAYTGPILPGEKEFFFSYELPYRSASHTLSKEILYPIGHLDVLVADNGVEVTGPALIAQEPVSIRDRRYLHLTAEDLAPGDGLTLHLANLPLEGRPAEPSMPGSTVLVRAVIGVGTLAVLLVLAYPFLKNRQGKEG